jgi:hypothetical protein
MEYCSPTNRFNSYTCFSNKSLIKIAKAYNNSLGNSVGGGSKITIPNEPVGDKDREKLWKEIKTRFQNIAKCEDDYCIIDTAIVKSLGDREILEEFRPEMPYEWYSNKNEWLSNFDIEAVMKQYMKLGNFLFIGPVPIDFDTKLKFGQCVAEELCKLNLEQLYLDGIRKIGIVFNLDPHYEGGSHWVSMFADLDNGGIYFFDSYGFEPEDEIRALMERIQRQGNELIRKGIIDISLMEPSIDQHIPIRSHDPKTKTMILEDVRNIAVGFPIIGQSNYGWVTKISSKTINYKTIDNKPLVISGSQLRTRGFRKFYNNIRFQFKNSECGIYSTYVITELLSGKSFQELITNVIDDDIINRKRGDYFRPNMKKILEVGLKTTKDFWRKP